MKTNRFLMPALAVMIAAPAASRLAAQTGDVEPVKIERVAEKLGVKLQTNSARELELGRSVTATLDDPRKLANHGIKTMHEGARVTITCVGPARIRVEADEMEPVEHNEVVTLQVSQDGSLTSAPRPAPKPPGA